MSRNVQAHFHGLAWVLRRSMEVQAHGRGNGLGPSLRHAISSEREACNPPRGDPRVLRHDQQVMNLTWEETVTYRTRPRLTVNPEGVRV